jgi:hypothetical protein
MGRHRWSTYLRERRRLLIVWDPTEVEPAAIGDVAAYANDLNTGQPAAPIAVSVALAAVETRYRRVPAFWLETALVSVCRGYD